jgi:hypothetical protein
MTDRALILAVAFMLVCAIAAVAAQARSHLSIVCTPYEFAGYVVKACEVRP